MEVNRFSPMVSFSKKEEAKLPKIDKERIANAGKKTLTGLSCLAASGYYLVANQLSNKEKGTIETLTDSVNKLDGSDKLDTQSSGNIDDSEHIDGFTKMDDDGDDGINPGYDGKTQVVLALTTDGRCIELYRLSDGKYITPVNYHFPNGRSLSDLTFSLDDDSDFGGSYGNGGFGDCSISSVNPSYSRPVETDFSTMSYAHDFLVKKMIHNMRITHVLGSLDGAEKILEELRLPENEDVCEALYSRANISRSKCEDIVMGHLFDFEVLELCKRNLFYSCEKNQDKKLTPFARMIIMKIDDRIDEINEKGLNYSST